MSKMQDNQPKIDRGSYSSYIVGFLLSLALTLGAYYLVLEHVNSHHHSFAHPFLIFLVVGLAIIQLFTQLVFFLHLGQERKPRFNLAAFLFMLLVLGILVFGSLWIMQNLDYNMMPQEMDQYMREQNKKGF